jgi:parallel beta-helix repeat protein
MLKKIQGHISSLRDKVSENFQKSFIALTVAVVVLGGFFVAGSALAATTWTVGSSEADFTTIQEAINAAADGDTINVAAGTYTNDIWDSSLGIPAGYRITKSVTLLGANAGVNPEGSLDRGGETILVRTNGVPYSLYADEIVIDGFTFTSGGGSGGGRLIISGDNITIRNTIIKNISGTDPHGIYIYPDAENALVSNNTISNTGWDAIGCDGNAIISGNVIKDITNTKAITLGATSNVEVLNNTITNTHHEAIWSDGTVLISGNTIDTTGGKGITLYINSVGEIADNIISNATYEGIQAWASATITGNEIFNDYKGIQIRNAASGWIIQNNNIHDNTYEGLEIPNYEGSEPYVIEATISNNTFSNNGYPGIHIGGGTNCDNINVNSNKLLGNGIYDLESVCVSQVNAKKNWWGTTNGIVIGSKVGGYVDYDPWYLDEEMETLSSAVERGNIYVNATFDENLTEEGLYFGFNAFVTIQEGIDAVDEGGTINVAAGTYEEAITINKPLTVKGAGSGGTVIDAGAVLPVINIDSSNVTLEGLKVVNGNWGVGVRNASDIENINFKDVVVDSSTASGFVFDGLGKVSNITFTDCRADNNGDRGIYFAPQAPSENVILTNTSADNNQIMGFNNQGIMTNLTIKGGTFNGNVGGSPKDTTEGPYYGFGISVENTTSVDIQRITAENNGTEGPAEGGAGIVIKGSSSGVNISEVILTGNKIGLWLEPKWGSNPVPEDTTITNSKIFNNVDYEVKNDIEEIIVDATNNWWGTFSSTEIAAKISDNVSYEPYCAVADCSLIYNEITEADSPLAGANTAIPKSTGATATSTPSVTFLSTATITVTDGGGESTVTIPEGVVITRADGENLDTTQLTSSSVDSASLAGLGTGVVTEGALQWGIENIGLEFDPAITINIFVGTDLNGQTLDIVRSTSGSDGWTNDGISPTSCVVSDGLCTFETTRASYFAATNTLPPAPSSGRTSGTSSEIVFLEEETVVQETEETVIPETVEELPESVVEEEVPSVPFTEAEELLIPEEESLPEETTPSEETAPRREALVFPPVEVIPEQGLASLLLATIGAIRESAWMSITVIFCLLGLAVIGIREWEFTRKTKRQ